MSEELGHIIERARALRDAMPYSHGDVVVDEQGMAHLMDLDARLGPRFTELLDDYGDVIMTAEDTLDSWRDEARLAVKVKQTWTGDLKVTANKDRLVGTGFIRLDVIHSVADEVTSTQGASRFFVEYRMTKQPLAVVMSKDTVVDFAMHLSPSPWKWRRSP